MSKRIFRSSIAETLARITHRQLRVLGFVHRHPDAHGLQVADVLKLTRANVYLLLPRLEHIGLVESRWIAREAARGRPEKHVYRITQHGIDVLCAARLELQHDIAPEIRWDEPPYNVKPTHDLCLVCGHVHTFESGADKVACGGCTLCDCKSPVYSLKSNLHRIVDELKNTP